MDFMKVFDQTVREIKREVNIKVLKVPEMEQKVLDATDSEPWGPHGTALAEIAQATKKFTECQMVMNVLWTRLTDTGRNWRHVYKALTVIEYLVAHGSERALDDITEHTFQISSLSGFEYVEPNGKDMGINVRKKAENLLALLNNKDKIQGVREKAAANRDKYIGLSSSGITYKSGSASYGSYGSGSGQYNDRYGGIGGTKEGDMFKSSYKVGDRFEDEEFRKDSHGTERRGIDSEDEGNNVKKGSASYGRLIQSCSFTTMMATCFPVHLVNVGYKPFIHSVSLLVSCAIFNNFTFDCSELPYF
ncbi:clathrin interactor EPSIN 1-like [Macadamia integrifolia]|uniref:clathrin interactor EPSIN 1-like n=1 Tax=Macadamia integrifolia TaxID=60698 RepID=UPI001C4FA0CE|nr:clathrin interactor EPSIN 1-like [Macadamia integrifolia]